MTPLELAKGPFAAVIAVARRRSESSAATNGLLIFANQGLIGNIMSYLLSPTDLLASLMSDSRFDTILAKIQRFAILPSRYSAIDLFWKNNKSLIDLEEVRTSYLSVGDPEASEFTESLRARLLVTAVAFVALRDALTFGLILHFKADGKDDDDGNFVAQKIDHEVLNRCFRAFGLLTFANYDISPKATLYKLREVDLSQTQVTDLTPLSSLVDLIDLNLEGTEVDDLSPLKSLTKLEQLNLMGSQVSDPRLPVFDI